jgi:Uma2 family endonuclease
MSTATQSLTLEEFLKLPETKPASEFVNGQVIQKPMSQGEHSRIQGKLCGAINQVGEAAKIAYASQSYAVHSLVNPSYRI